MAAAKSFSDIVDSSSSSTSISQEDLLSQVESLRKLQREDQLQRRQQMAINPNSLASSETNKVIQLPIWNEEQRPILHDLARSALFTCRQKEARAQLKTCPVHSVEHITIFYTGEELRQRDLDVYLVLLHIARGSRIDGWIYFSATSIVKALSWTYSGRSYTELEDCIRRLKACSLEVESRMRSGKKIRYGGSLIGEFALETDGSQVGRWAIKLNPRIVAMFAPGCYSQIDWSIRIKLSPVAKWLQAFYATNVEPYAMKVERLCRLSGSTAKQLKHFRATLKRALHELTEHGIIDSFQIDETDKVRVIKKARATISN